MSAPSLPRPPIAERRQIDLTDPRPAVPPLHQHRPASTVIGLLLLGGGALWLAAELGWLDVGWRAATATALLLIGIAVTGLGLTGHRTGPLIGLGVALTLILTITLTVPAPNLAGGVGDRVERPTTAGELAERYELGVGTLTLDLRAVDLPAGTTRVAGAVGAGELTVRVPDDVTVVVHADVGMGESDVLGQQRDGVGFDVERTDEVAGAEAVLELDLDVSTGQIEVTR